MTKARLIGLVVLAVGASTFAATVHAARGHTAGDKPSAANCGGNLWRLKTLSDVDRGSVNLSPRPTTIGAILQRHDPGRVPTRRTTPFQRQTWEVPAAIIRYWLDGTELRLQLFDDHSYMNAVIPSPSCLPATTRGRSAIIQAWQLFNGACGHPTRTAQPLGAVVSVTGVGYWSERKSRHGEASNGAELHPVTGLRPVAGCGS
jgi:hypothetical protein